MIGSGDNVKVGRVPSVIVIEPTCLVCREAAGDVRLPGGLFDAGDVLLGHHLVVPKRHTRDFGTLTDSEATTVGSMLRLLSAALTEMGAEHVYVFAVGHSVPHLHIHVVPRWPGVPESIHWAEIKDLPGPQRVDFR